jgi:hypothetical protein
MIINYPVKYNEPLPFSQRIIIAVHLLAWIGSGLRGQHVHVNPGYLTRHGQHQCTSWGWRWRVDEGGQGFRRGPLP